jgi:hypothetical protein
MPVRIHQLDPYPVDQVFDGSRLFRLSLSYSWNRSVPVVAPHYSDGFVPESRNNFLHVVFHLFLVMFTQHCHPGQCLRPDTLPKSCTSADALVVCCRLGQTITETKSPLQLWSATLFYRGTPLRTNQFRCGLNFFPIKRAKSAALAAGVVVTAAVAFAVAVVGVEGELAEGDGDDELGSMAGGSSSCVAS